MPPSVQPPPVHVLAQTANWVVVAKPPRLLVHRRPDSTDLHYAVQLVRNAVGRRVHLVHRLDRATSGCLLCALDPTWARTLQAAMADPTAVKTYLALVRGRWAHEEPVDVDAPLKDDRGRLQEAHTWFEGITGSAEPRASLVRARPTTGRTHQVRRHLVRLSHPILLDSSHGDTRANRMWREQHGLTRLGLHCLSLDLPLPDGTRLKVTSPLFEDHHTVFQRQPWWEEARVLEPALDLLPLPLGA